MEILLFEVCGQRHALPSKVVREVLPAVTVTPMAGTDRLVEGVVNVRGDVLAAVDARAWLGLPSRPAEPSDHLIVVRADERTALLHVDRAMELATMASGQFDDRTQMAKLADGPVQVHEIGALLSQVLAPDRTGSK